MIWGEHLNNNQLNNINITIKKAFRKNPMPSSRSRCL